MGGCRNRLVLHVTKLTAGTYIFTVTYLEGTCTADCFQT